MSWSILPAEAVRALKAYEDTWNDQGENYAAIPYAESLLDVLALRALHDTDVAAWELIIGLEESNAAGVVF